MELLGSGSGSRACGSGFRTNIGAYNILGGFLIIIIVYWAPKPFLIIKAPILQGLRIRDERSGASDLTKLQARDLPSNLNPT